MMQKRKSELKYELRVHTKNVIQNHITKTTYTMILITVHSSLCHILKT